MKFLRSISFAFIIILFPVVSFCQDCLDCGPGDTPEDVPFDDGLILFILVAIGYGVMKFYKERTKTLA